MTNAPAARSTHVAAPPFIYVTMIGLLSLPDELIELVGKAVIDSRQAGLREWCRVTSTCKRLWAMQLPESISEWSLDLDDELGGESKMKQA